MAEEYDLQLQSAISAINDVVSRIDSLYEPSEIGSIILRLEFINRMLVNLDDVVNTMLRLHDATKRIEARYNSHISAHNGYQASLDRTGRRGRPAFIITAEQLTFHLSKGQVRLRTHLSTGQNHIGGKLVLSPLHHSCSQQNCLL